MRASDERNGIGPRARDEDDGRVLKHASLERLVSHARRGGVDADRRGASEARCGEDVPTDVELERMHQASVGVLDALDLDLQIALALEVPRLGAHRLRHGDERIGEALGGEGLLDRELLGPGPGRNDDEPIGIVRLGDDGREDRAALIEPREVRPQVGTSNLERAKYRGPQGRVGLSERNIEDPFRELGGALLKIPGRVDGDDACRMQ